MGTSWTGFSSPRRKRASNSTVSSSNSKPSRTRRQVSRDRFCGACMFPHLTVLLHGILFVGSLPQGFYKQVVGIERDGPPLVDPAKQRLLWYEWNCNQRYISILVSSVTDPSVLAPFLSPLFACCSVCFCFGLRGPRIHLAVAGRPFWPPMTSCPSPSHLVVFFRPQYFTAWLLWTLLIAQWSSHQHIYRYYPCGAPCSLFLCELYRHLKEKSTHLLSDPTAHCPLPTALRNSSLSTKRFFSNRFPQRTCSVPSGPLEMPLQTSNLTFDSSPFDRYSSVLWCHIPPSPERCWSPPSFNVSLPP